MRSAGTAAVTSTTTYTTCTARTHDEEKVAGNAGRGGGGRGELGGGEKEEKGVEEEECGKGVSKRTDEVTGRLNKKRVGMERVGGKRKG